MDARMIQALMSNAGTDTDPRMQQMQRQQKMIDAMRQEAIAPRGGGPAAGATYGPALQQIMSGIAAKQMQGKADTEMATLNQERAGNRTQNLDALIMALRKQIPQSNTAMLPPDGMEDQ